MARLDYANARIGARRARLLGPAALRDLLTRPTLEARLEVLRARAAGAALAAPGAGASAAAADPISVAEAALRAALQQEEAQLLEDAEGARARTLLEAVLAIEEASAVKAIVRGVAFGGTVERVVAVALPCPGLDAQRILEAASATAVEGALGLLAGAGSPVAMAALGALGERAKHGLLPLELAADRAALERAARRARGPGEDRAVVRAHVEDRIDARNAATLLALAGTSPLAETFVRGGRRLDEATFRRLAPAGPAELRAALAPLFGCAPEDLERPWSADRALERAVLEPLRRAARVGPLSIAVPLAYLLERRAEVRRVSLVLRGAALGLPGDELLELVGA